MAISCMSLPIRIKSPHRGAILFRVVRRSTPTNVVSSNTVGAIHESPDPVPLVGAITDRPRAVNNRPYNRFRSYIVGGDVLDAPKSPSYIVGTPVLGCPQKWKMWTDTLQSLPLEGRCQPNRLTDEVKNLTHR